MDNKKINEDLVKFWDTALTISAEDKEEALKYTDLDYKELAPSVKLLNAVSELGQCENVLDYGCGTAWGAIVALKAGVKKVDAVDLGENIIDSAKFYAKLYNAENGFNAFKVDETWLNEVENNTYDGVICSNVLDVVTEDISLSIIKNLSRVLKKGSKAIIGLNFYMSEEKAKARGIELVDGNKLFQNGVLRLLSLSDEEWTSIFNKYFNVIKLDHFAWEGEPVESRRLFILEKK